MRALAISASNRAAAGVYEDRSGPVLAELLRSAGCTVDGPLVVPDGEPVEAALRDAVTAGYDVVVTTGGTGLTPGDLTPEMTRRVVDREIPGIAEAIDWLAALDTLGVAELDVPAIDRTLGSVLKYREDQDVIKAAGLATLAGGRDSER